MKKVVAVGDALGITDPKVRVKNVIPEAELAEMWRAEAAELLAKQAREMKGGAIIGFVGAESMRKGVAPAPSPAPPEPK